MKITEAIALAQKWHKGQKYGKEDYFGGHLFHVLRRVQVNYAGNEVMEVVAVLHDILEDTKCPESEVAKFGSEVLDAVKLLTKKPGDSRKVYLRSLAQNTVAWEVKWCDASANLQASVEDRDEKRIARYAETLSILSRLRAATSNLQRSDFSQVRSRFMERPDLSILDCCIVLLKNSSTTSSLSEVVRYSVSNAVHSYIEYNLLRLASGDTSKIINSVTACYLSQLTQFYEREQRIRLLSFYVSNQDRAFFVRLLKDLRALCVETAEKEN